MIHLIGNAHLDPAWLWQYPEGLAEIKATFRSALDRLAEFPDFVFTCACASYYEWVEHNCPEMFAQIQARVAEGRWAIVGGWWLQPDCNLPSGESFARQALYAQRYFREKFGVMAKVGYNVDSFGHNGMLPQLLRKSGMEAYIFMRPGPHENGDIPGPLFRWESPDGSAVTAFRIRESYGTFGGEREGLPPALADLRADQTLGREAGVPMMSFFGVGNHGGGPTVRQLRQLEPVVAASGGTVAFSQPNAFFASVQGLPLPSWRGELQHHASGCYAAVSQLKSLNRAAEQALIAAESASCAADMLLGQPYPMEALRRAWKLALFNQFHDILGGCCIRPACEDAVRTFHEAQSTADRLRVHARNRVSWAVDTMGNARLLNSKEKSWNLWEQGDRGAPVVVFNPLPFPREVEVRISAALAGVCDAQGQPLPHQRVRGYQTNGADKWQTLFRAPAPAMGYTLCWGYLDRVLSGEAPPLSAGPLWLENEFLRLELDPETGGIASLVDKRRDRELMASPSRAEVVDEEACDTWAHGVFSFPDILGTFADPRIELLESGPVRARLRVLLSYGNSRLRLDYLLYAGEGLVRVSAHLLWLERHRQLKLAFPLNLAEPTARAEMAYGIQSRPANGEEEPMQQWVSLGDPAGGLAVVNDGRYSYSATGATLRITAVRSPIYADHFGQDFRDEDCEYTDQGESRFRLALMPHGPGLEPVVRAAYDLNAPAGDYVWETYHEGPLPPAAQGIRIEGADNLLAPALKRGEDGGYVLRLVEIAGRPAAATIALPLLGRSFPVRLAPWAVETYLIPDDPAEEVVRANLLEFAQGGNE